MTSPLPPDPYAALGVSKNADAGTIKSTYRKLVLKCHPDKVTDESKKREAAEAFHKIQQAYELIGDEDKRATYDAEVKLNELRKEKLARAGGGRPDVEIRTAHYDIRTAAPASASFGARGPARYEERKPSRYDDDRYYEDRSSSRKYPTYEAYPKHDSPRTSRTEKEHVRTTRPSSDRTRSDPKKARDKEERRDRSHKFVYVEDDSSSADENAREKARYEAEYRRRSEDARRRADEEEARRQAADARRKAEDRRSSEEPRKHRSDDPYDRQQKINKHVSEAVNYIHAARGEADSRPSPGRSSSSRDARPEYSYDSRSSRRPDPVRRSSARPKESSSSRPLSSGRDRDRGDRKVFPEIVEWDESDRKVPSFGRHTSSPAELHVPRTTPQRSYTETTPRDHRRTETSPTPVFRRSETMPSVPSSHPSSSRRKEAAPANPSKLRETVVPHDSGYSSPGTPENTYHTVPPAQSSSTKKIYHYPTPGGGVRITPEDLNVANGHRTILREPDRHRARSPSPLTRPPIGPNRPSESRAHQPAAPTPPRTTPLTVPPPLQRSPTINVSPVRSDERGRSQGTLYGEIPSDYTRRENRGRQTSFSPDQVSYTRRLGHDDIKWSRGRDPVEKDRDYARPSLSRNATYVY